MSREKREQNYIYTALISFGASITVSVEGGKSTCKCLLKSYVINLIATYPPDAGRPLWKIPAPEIGTGGFDSTDWMSRNGIVFCAASVLRSLGAKFKYCCGLESGSARRGVRVGISGFSSFSSVLRTNNFVLDKQKYIYKYVKIFTMYEQILPVSVVMTDPQALL